MAWPRSLLFFVFLFTITPLMALLCAPALFFGEGPARACIRSWARLMLGALHVICGVRYRLIGAENITSGGAIIASNHQSMWETISLFAFLPRPVMVFKKELARNPVYRFWAKYAGVAIDRTAGVKAIRALSEAARHAISEGRQFILFPEGTRVAPGRTRPFQSGVAAVYKSAGAPCVPIAHNSGAHWLHPGPLKRPGEIIIKVLPAIEAGLPRKEFEALLEARINAARPDLASSVREEPSENADAPMTPA